MLDEHQPLNPKTERDYINRVRQFESWLAEMGKKTTYPPRRAVVMAYLNYLGVDRGLRHQTLSATVAAIGYWSEREHKRLLSPEDRRAYRNAVGQKKRREAEAGQKKKKAYPLRPADMGRLLRLIDASNHPNAERDAAAFALMWSAALRGSEMTGLLLGDITVQDDQILVHLQRSKGDQAGNGKAIIARDYGAVWQAPGLIQRIRDWLNGGRAAYMEQAKDRNNRQGENHLFCSPSRSWIGYACRRWREEVGIHFTGHSTRRGFATTQVENKTNLALLQMHMRHGDPKTTAEYYEGLNLTQSAAEMEKVAAGEGGDKSRCAAGEAEAGKP